MIRKSVATLLLFLFLYTVPATAQDVMEKTLHDSIYGGVIGAIVGAAVMALSDDPGDNIEYIPTGAAVGVLLGAAYGLGSSTTEYYGQDTREEGDVAVKNIKVRDRRTNTEEFLTVVDVVGYRW